MKKYFSNQPSCIMVILSVLLFLSNGKAQTVCASKPDGSQPRIAIPPSQAVSAGNSSYSGQRLSEKISDILQNSHCFQVIDPNRVIALLKQYDPGIQTGTIDPANAARYGEVLGNDFFFQSKVISWDEKWTARTLPFPLGRGSIGYKYSLRMEFKVEILCLKGVYGYSHIETMQFEKNVGTNREVPNDRDVKIDEMLQAQCKLLLENLAGVIAQCSRDNADSKPKPSVSTPPVSIQVKLTSINYDQYTAIDSCLKRHSDSVTIVNDNSFRNNAGHIDVMLKGNVQSLVDMVRNCVNLRVTGVQSNLIELSGQ